MKKSDKLNKPTPPPGGGKGNSKGGHSGTKQTVASSVGTGSVVGCSEPDLPKHTSWCLVKDRSEPCHILHVNHIVAAVHNVRPWELASLVLDNTNKLFFPE